MATDDKTYREMYKQSDLKYFRVLVEETDLYVGVPIDKFTREMPGEIEELVKKQRDLLKHYIDRDAAFLTALSPHTLQKGAPEIAQRMVKASKAAGTGPMSAVAGALSEFVVKTYAQTLDEIIVENGGDIYLQTAQTRRIGIFAGNSPFTNKIAIDVYPGQSPLAICTSSGTVGHALSFGVADAAVVLSPCGALADAVATAMANRIKDAGYLQAAVGFALKIENISGALAIKDDKIALAGEINLAPLT